VGNELLNRIDFKWRVMENDVLPWDDRLSQLLEYKEEHGHMQVPQRYDSNPQLGQWVQKMRLMRKMGMLKRERIEKLDEVGLVWKGTKRKLRVLLFITVRITNKIL
jgi:hypothetical protein